MRLHQARMHGYDAHAGTARATFGRRNASSTNVVSVAVGIAALGDAIQASSGSGPSGREDVVAGLAAPRSKAGMRKPSASHR